MVTETQELPFVSCLCPTFHRPRLLANALACFLAQDYPADRRELIICDDGSDFEYQAGTGWELASAFGRFTSLSAKFNSMARGANGDVLLTWEDDDIYLPHHISSHVAALQRSGCAYSKPSHVLSTYTGHVETEEGAGRFHASIAFTRELFERAGGWPVTKRADFDQQFLGLLNRTAGGAVCDPCTMYPPSYCFRYGSTQTYHGQHFMRSADDETWYDRVPRNPGNRDLVLTPEFDEETKAVYATHGVGITQ